MIEQLLLIRHGETVHNAAGIAQGWNDSALSDEGRRQVLRLAARLSPLHPTEIYSSPLGRALTTAELIGDACALPVTTLEDLREMSYGSWEGRSFLDVRREDNDTYLRWVADPDVPSPQGESHNDVLRRMRRAFETIEANGGAVRGRRVLVVTHGTAIRIGATALLGVPIAAARSFAQDNASLNLFLWRSDRYVLKVWNDTSHCE